MKYSRFLRFITAGLVIPALLGTGLPMDGEGSSQPGFYNAGIAFFAPVNGDSIRMTYPENIIVDPHADTVSFYFYNPELFWGDEGNYYDTVIRISANATYQWINVTIKDVIENKYLCVTHDKIFLSDTSNTLYFRMEWEEDGNKFDTIYTETIRYCKPMIEITELEGIPYTGGTAVVYEPIVHFKLNAGKSFNYVGPTLNDKIKSVEYRLNGSGQFTGLLSFVPPINGISLDTVMELPQLNYGYNTIEFRVLGKHRYDLPEYSDIRKATIFLLNFDLGDLPDDTVCALAYNYKLNGKPDGGYFTGPGIVDQTNIFNPALADPGANEITYHFNVSGNEATISHTITVNPLPSFDLEGSREVCSNAYDVPYEIIGTGLDDCTFSWEISNGKVLEQSDDRHLTIHWGEPGMGKITITMTFQDNPVCSSSAEYFVDIDPTVAPDPCFLSLQNGNLLVCSDPTANVYRWYKDGVLIETGAPINVPYLLLTGNYFPSATVATDYHVETAFVDDIHSCFTESYHYLHSPDLSNLKTSGQPELSLSPNPAGSQVVFSLVPPPEGNCSWQFLDLEGRVMQSGEASFDQYGKGPVIDLNHLPPGIYMVKVITPATWFVEKIIVF